VNVYINLIDNANDYVAEAKGCDCDAMATFAVFDQGAEFLGRPYSPLSLVGVLDVSIKVVSGGISQFSDPLDMRSCCLRGYHCGAVISSPTG
jgi:hypothetical protein